MKPRKPVYGEVLAALSASIREVQRLTKRLEESHAEVSSLHKRLGILRFDQYQDQQKIMELRAIIERKMQ